MNHRFILVLICTTCMITYHNSECSNQGAAPAQTLEQKTPPTYEELVDSFNASKDSTDFSLSRYQKDTETIKLILDQSPPEKATGWEQKLTLFEKRIDHLQKLVAAGNNPQECEKLYGAIKETFDHSNRGYQHFEKLRMCAYKFKLMHQATPAFAGTNDSAIITALSTLETFQNISEEERLLIKKRKELAQKRVACRKLLEQPPPSETPHSEYVATRIERYQSLHNLYGQEDPPATSMMQAIQKQDISSLKVYQHFLNTKEKLTPDEKLPLLATLLQRYPHQKALQLESQKCAAQSAFNQAKKQYEITDFSCGEAVKTLEEKIDVVWVLCLHQDDVLTEEITAITSLSEECSKKLSQPNAHASTNNTLESIIMTSEGSTTHMKKSFHNIVVDENYISKDE